MYLHNAMGIARYKSMPSSTWFTSRQLNMRETEYGMSARAYGRFATLLAVVNSNHDLRIHSNDRAAQHQRGERKENCCIFLSHIHRFLHSIVYDFFLNTKRILKDYFADIYNFTIVHEELIMRLLTFK